LGLRRARAALLLNLALPGSVYLYQGEELGLEEVEDIPDALRQDPMFHRTQGRNPGRDGCRVPIPWSGEAPPFGFSPPDAAAPPWLPQPPAWRDRTVAAQTGDPDSMLELYRRALTSRRQLPDLGDGDLTWLPAPESVLAFRRGRITCVVNLSERPIARHTVVPALDAVVLASGPLDGDHLPPDTTVWMLAR
jgi:alpha-glucosidase